MHNCCDQLVWAKKILMILICTQFASIGVLTGFVNTGDDTTHPIIGKVPLSMQDEQTKYLKDVFYVPTITKNLILIGQMVEQGL
jgi:hypothetical protein